MSIYGTGTYYVPTACELAYAEEQAARIHPLDMVPAEMTDAELHRALVIIILGGDGSRPTEHEKTFLAEFDRRGLVWADPA